MTSGTLLPVTIAVLFVGMTAPFVVYVAWSLYFRPKRDGQRWAATAQALGLVLERKTPSHKDGFYNAGPTVLQRMHGQRGGMSIRAGMRVVVTGSGDNRHKQYYTSVEVALPRSLELGVRVSPSEWLEDVFGADDLQTGHPALDSAYRIEATIGDQVRALLRVPYVTEPLLALSRSRFRPHLSDRVVKLEAQQKCFDASTLDVALDQAVEVAHRLVSARSSLGPSYVQRVVSEAWRSVADARGLSLDLHRLMMAGRTEGAYVEVHALQEGDRCITAFLMHFDRPLGLGLSLTRQNGFSRLGALIGMEDIETGDAAFDGRFVVKGRPEHVVRAVLKPEVRARLVQLQEQASELRVEDDRLRADVGWLVSEPAWLDAGIAAIAQAGLALSGALRAGARPYEG